jgi:putative ABC transport system permease protein
MANMGIFLSDLRYAARTLLKQPGFTAIVVLTLALGIGANTAIFSVVNAVLLRSLPFAEPNRLVAVLSGYVKGGEEQFGNASGADFLDWRAQTQSFENLAAHAIGPLNFTGADQPEQFTAARVSDQFFEAFNVQPLLGRTILPEEHLSGGNRVVVLSRRLWQRRFGGNPNIVGQTLMLGGSPTTVVGVMPAAFREPAYAELWRPLIMDTGEMKPREARYFSIIGRLKPGVPLAEAQSEMNVIAQRLALEHPETNTDWSVRLLGLHELGVTNVRAALLVLLGAVGFVLLIACANVANLLLARGTARHKEIAIRIAIGATRQRIVRELLLESLLLALFAGAVGSLLAIWSVDVLTGLIPADLSFPRLAESRVDAPALLFTLGISVLTGIVFGLVPALKASNPSVYESLKASERGATAGLSLQRMRGLLVVAQMALTLLLLVGAGLLIKSLHRLQRVDPGFDPRNLLTANIMPPRNKFYIQDENRSRLFQRILEEVAKIPGVESAAANSSPPLANFGLDFTFEIEGRTPTSGDKPEAFYSAISPGYFRTMASPLRGGREFTDRDSKDAPPVAIINETMARRYFPEGEAIGKRIKIKHLSDEVVAHEIVGIARDTKQTSLSRRTAIEMFAPHLQHPWLSTALLVRTRVEPGSIAFAVQRAVSIIDKDQPIAQVKTMEQLMSESTAQPRFYALLLGIFAGVALLLAVIGIYGVMSYTVAQRTHEIGIRMALGAKGGDVLRLIIGQGMMHAVIGIALGLAASIALTRLLSGLLYGIGADDPLTFTAGAILLATVALIAAYIAARKATKGDPMIALRVA